MKEQMIRDTDYTNALSELGFCVAPLFSQAQIDTLQALYAAFEASNNVTGLVASHSKGSTALSLYVSNSIKEILSPSLEHWLQRFQFFSGRIYGEICTYRRGVPIKSGLGYFR